MRLTRLTVLVDNGSSRPGIVGEHGLSVLIERGGGSVLFDAGASPLMVDNARRMGVDLTGINAIALSHGHYDHVGGLDAVLAVTGPSVGVVAHREAGTRRYSIKPGAPARSIGANFSRPARGRLRTATSPLEIISGVTWLGQIPRVTGFEDTGGPFFLDTAGTKPDPLLDDTALLVETGKGPVLVTGCSHSGIVNILRYVADIAGSPRFAAVIGGMHLGQAPEERIRRTLAAFDELQVGRVGPMHCTGRNATAVMQKSFGDRFIFCMTGTVLEF